MSNSVDIRDTGDEVVRRRIRGARTRAFLWAQLFLLSPLALYLLPLEGPYVLVKIALLVPCAVLITLPAILLSTIGVDVFDFGEFGAIPKDTLSWALIFLFWSLVALLWSWLRVRRADTEIAEEPGDPTG